MSLSRRRDMMMQNETEEQPIFHAPLAFNGDNTDHVSGNSPIISNGTMTWDSSKNMYKFVISNGSSLQYVAKWNIDDRYKGIDNFINGEGFTIIVNIIQESAQGNGWHAWYSVPNLATRYGISSSAYPYIYASPFRFNSSYKNQYISLARYATVLSFTEKKARFYMDGILKNTYDWGTSSTINLPELKDVGVCELQSNNYACSMWANNLKVYSRAMSAEEILQEYQNSQN